MLKRGDQIAYIPNHADDFNHSDVEFGFIQQISAAEYFAKCRFWRKGELGVLRTIANSETTPIENLVKYNSVDQSIVEQLLELINQEKM